MPKSVNLTRNNEETITNTPCKSLGMSDKYFNFCVCYDCIIIMCHSQPVILLWKKIKCYWIVARSA